VEDSRQGSEILLQNYSKAEVPNPAAPTREDYAGDEITERGLAQRNSIGTTTTSKAHADSIYTWIESTIAEIYISVLTGA
jgi:hypothetical protein